MATKPKPNSYGTTPATGSDRHLSEKESIAYGKGKIMPGENKAPGYRIRQESGDMSTGTEYYVAPFGFGKNQKGSQNRATKTKQKER